MIAALTRRKIAWSTLVQYLGKAIQMGLSILMLRWITNYLGSTDYALYGKIAEYALFFSVAANLGIFANTVRKMAEAPKDGLLFTNTLILRIVSSLIFFTLGGLYAWLFLPDLRLGVLLFMSALFFDYITSVCDGMLQARYWMGRATFALVLGRVAALVIVYLLIQNPGNAAPLFFLAPLTGAVLTAALSLFFVRQGLTLNWKLQPQLIKMLFLTALPFGIINLLNNLYFRFIPSALAARQLPDEVFSHYNLALHMATVASLASTFLMFSVLPALKQAIHYKHKRTAKELYKKIRRLLLAAAIALPILGSLLGPMAIKLLTNESFIVPGYTHILPLFLILAGISYLYDLVLLTLFALEEDLWFLKTEIIALTLASTVFAMTFLTKDPQWSAGLILLGAIVGEASIVLLASRRISQLE